MRDAVLRCRSLWRRLILKRFPRCVRCGEIATDAMHVYGKGAFPHMDVHPQNGLGGCRGCHSYFDHGAGREELLAIAAKKIPNFKFVTAAAHNGDKLYRDYEQIEKELTELLK